MERSGKQALINAVIVVKPASSNKADVETACRQVAQITTLCVPKSIHIEDIIVTYQSIKDIKKRVNSLMEHKEIKVLLIYSAKQIASSEKEYMEFVAELRDFYSIQVMNYR